MVLSAKLRNRKLATPCTNYGTVGENMESGVLFVAYLFGTFEWLGLNIGFWVSMAVVVIIVILMNVVFWSMKQKK